MEFIDAFLKETHYDIQNRFGRIFYWLYWNPWEWNNLTDEEIIWMGWLVSWNDWMPVPVISSSNLFITDRSAGNYVFEKGIDETTGKEYIYGKLSKKAIEQIQNSLMQ